MSKKRCLSGLLSLVVLVSTVLAFSTMTVFAGEGTEVEPSSCTISDSEFTITHSGMTDFQETITSFTFGTLNDGYSSFIYNVSSLTMYAYNGELSDGQGNVIPFYPVRSYQSLPYENDTYVYFYDLTPEKNVVDMRIYIDPEQYMAAPAGIYTGTMTLGCQWWESGGDNWAFGDPLYVNLTLVVPEKAGDSIEWRYDSTTKELKILGSGAMYDFADAESIPWYTYKDEITSVVVEPGVTNVGNNAFKNCTALKAVTLDRSVVSIGKDSFYGCTALSDIYVKANPADLTWNEDGNDFIAGYATTCHVASRLTADYKAKFNNVNVTFAGYVVNEGGSCGADVNWYLDGDDVIIISGSGPMGEFGSSSTPWYSQRDQIVGVIIKDGVTSVGSYAFYNCDNLTTATIPDSVTSIGRDAFSYCEKLTYAPLPSKLTELGLQAFSNTGISSITIPKTLQTIPDGAFSGTKLTSVTVPNTVTSLGKYVFSNCSNLTSIELPDSLTDIGEMAFSRTAIRSIKLPKNMEYTSDELFYGCEHLESVELPETLKYVGWSLFSGCTSLKSVSIPNTVTGVGYGAFYKCTSLESIELPEGVTEIRNNAFTGCTSLKSINIPSTATSVSYCAFDGCKNIEDVYCYADPDKLDWDLGNNQFSMTANTRIHVPSQFVDAFKTKYPNLKFYIVEEKEEAETARLEGYSVSLDGSIGVNFYMTLGADVLAAKDTAYMKFTMNGKDEIIPVKDITPTEGGYYIFRKNTSAKEMADTITAQIYIKDGEKAGPEYSYTVRDYCMYIYNHQSGYPAEAYYLVKAMMNYGASCQIYFNHNYDGDETKLANYLMMSYDRTLYGTTASNIPFEQTVKKLTDGNIKVEQVSLSLKSNIVMYLYLSGVPDGTTFKVGDKTLRSSKSGNYTLVTVPDIPVQTMDKGIPIELYNGTTSLGTISYCPMKYCYLVMTMPYDDPVFTEDLRWVIRNLHQFSYQVKNYEASLKSNSSY